MEHKARKGCIGCVVLLAVAALVAGVVIAVALLDVRGDEPSDHVRNPDLSPTPSEERITVLVDLYHADVELVPVAAGESLQVESSYDASKYAFEEIVETGDGGSVYRVSLRRRGPAFMALLKQMMGARRPRMTIRVPSDAVRGIDIRARRGNAKVELGGLRLDDAQLDVSNGSLLVTVREPLEAPMERIAIKGRLGPVTVTTLGNASPRELIVNSHLGSLNIDLKGAWVADADVGITASAGGAAIQLPDGVRIEGLDRLPGVREDPELPRPTLRFTVRADHLQVVD